MLLLLLYLTPLAIWDIQNHCETLQGSRKCHLWQYHCLYADCGLGIAWSSAYHCKSISQSKQNILPVSILMSATPSDSSYAAYSLFDPSHGDYFQLHVAGSSPAQKSGDVLAESQKHPKSLSNEAAATFSVCWLPLYVLELCICRESTIMMMLGIPFILSALFFNICIHSSIFFVCVTVPMIQKQQNREAYASIKIKSILTSIS